MAEKIYGFNESKSKVEVVDKATQDATDASQDERLSAVESKNTEQDTAIANKAISSVGASVDADNNLTITVAQADGTSKSGSVALPAGGGVELFVLSNSEFSITTTCTEIWPQTSAYALTEGSPGILTADKDLVILGQCNTRANSQSGYYGAALGSVSASKILTALKSMIFGVSDWSKVPVGTYTITGCGRTSSGSGSTNLNFTPGSQGYTIVLTVADDGSASLDASTYTLYGPRYPKGSNTISSVGNDITVYFCITSLSFS